MNAGDQGRCRWMLATLGRPSGLDAEQPPAASASEGPVYAKTGSSENAQIFSQFGLASFSLKPLRLIN